MRCSPRLFFPFASLAALLLLASGCASQPTATLSLPTALQAEGIPPLDASVAEESAAYLQLGGATFRGWHPEKRAVLVSSRSQGVSHLHLIEKPRGKRQRLTSGTEPITSGRLISSPNGPVLVYSSDRGGDEQFQLQALPLPGNNALLLTDGSARNTSWRIAHDGGQVAYASNRRNNRDNDIFVSQIDGSSTRCLLQNKSPAWSVLDWTADDSTLLLHHGRTPRQTNLYLLPLDGGSPRLLTSAGENVLYHQARFAENDQAVYALSDADSDFLSLVRIDATTGERTPLLPVAPAWDIESFAISADEKTLAYVLNEDGFSRLHLLDLATRQPLPLPPLPGTILSNLQWHPQLREIGFTLSGASSPTDAWSLAADTGKLTRWTTRKANPTLSFVEPELIQVPSFDGLKISALVYRPDPGKFPGPRPVIVQFHGGPSSQSRPGFRGRANYYLNELGIGLIFPNVRGSSGYGQKFLQLDNALQREAPVRDAGAIFDWIQNDSGFDGSRIAVMGGSYGGFMTLATLVRYNDLLRCGVCSVGISNFAAFLKNTSDYRRDNRRQEYGDERVPEVRAFLEQISPANHAEKIKAPLLLIHGKNDNRVPVSEAEAMRDAIRAHNGTVWYLVADNEGHGFKKRPNVDYQFHATVEFLKEHLLAK